MKTNITAEHRQAFDAIVSGEYDNFALFSCFVNGQPACAIVAITGSSEECAITPLFVSVTDAMTLTDHNGNAI